MTDEQALRGPDFLPYQLPAPTARTVTAPVGPPPGPQKGRWNQALDGVPAWGVVSIAAGAAAFLLLLIVSFAASRPGPGAVVVILAAAVSLGAGLATSRVKLARDSRLLIQAGQALGIASAVISVVVYVASPSGGEDAVNPPSPIQTASVAPPSPDPTQSPGPIPLTTLPPNLVFPTPGPSVTESPGQINGFGMPSQPGGDSTSNDPSAIGTLLGHVIDTDGKPVSGASITITRSVKGDVSGIPGCPTRLTTETDANGEFRIGLCQLGNNLGYTVTITVLGGAKAQADLFINAGQTTVYDVILPIKHG